MASHGGVDGEVGYLPGVFVKTRVVAMVGRVTMRIAEYP